MLRIMNPFVGLVARAPARVQSKLLAAFLAIVALLIIMGAVGLQVLSGVNQRTEELIQLQRKIEAYRQVQHDTTSQLYSVATALLLADEHTLSSTLRQLNQFGYDVDRLKFVAKDEVELIEQFRHDYNRFIDVVTAIIELIRARPRGRSAADAAAGFHPAGRPARAADQSAGQQGRSRRRLRASRRARKPTSTAQWIVIAFAIGSIALALGLGYAISWSLVGPVKKIEAQLNQVAAGDFTQRVEVVNRDELGALGGRRQSDERGAGPTLPAAGIGQQAQIAVPCQHEP